MKIYPSRHSIMQTDKVNLVTDIPLAYIDTEYKDYSVYVKGLLKTTDIKPVLPYQQFTSQDIQLFKPLKSGVVDASDDFTPVIDQTSIIQRVGDNYQYIPTNATSFSPQEFTYSVVVKKNISYRNQKNYNMGIACIDDPMELAFAGRLIKIFGDAPHRGICPSNVWVNNKDMSVRDLANSYIRQNDFIFIESPDGKLYKNSYEETTIEFDQLLNGNANIWVSVDTFPIALTDNKTQIKSPVFYNDVESNCKTFVTSAISKSTFTISTEAKEEVTLHYVFKDNYSAAIIKEYKNKGFVIYTDKSMLDNVETNSKIIYEILMYVYSRSYLESSQVRTWITDKTPDYVIINNKLNTIDKFISVKQIHKFFDLPSTDVAFSNIKISASNVRMSGIANDHIVFEKLHTGANAAYADPQKPRDAMISIYTPERTIMYFDDFLYTVEDDIEELIKYSRIENSVEFNIRKFKHSGNNINISTQPFNDVQIPLTKTINYEIVPIETTSFYLCSKENIVSYCEISQYEERLGTKIAMLTISKTTEDIQVYDMRKRGGGLPKGYKDDHNLLDIGNMNGLAYRKAGTLVITLPKRLEEHKDIIYKVVRKHMISEKYPVILFEGDDMNEREKGET